MSYQDDTARLARSLVDLLGADPTPPGLLEPRQAQAVLVCRDTVVGAVRDLTGALLGSTTAPPSADPDLLIRSPVHALHAALRDLAPATGRDMALTDALTVPAGPAVTGWQNAGRAAVTLERNRDDAGRLPGPAAWSLARDLAALSSALPALDLDLATALTPAGPAISAIPASLDATAGRSVAALLDGPSHGSLQLSAAELTAHTADVPRSAAALPDRSPQQLRPVTRLADLPGAGRQLADLLHRRGSRLTTTEVRAVARTVTYGVALTARTLTAGAPDNPPVAITPPAGAQTASAQADSGRAGDRVPSNTPGPSTASGVDARDPARAVDQLRAALPDLQDLLHSDLQTLTPPAPGVLLLTQQIQTRLSAAGGLHDALTSGGTATARAALSKALTQWAVTAAPVLEAVNRALQQATGERTLLAPRQDDKPGRDAHLLWMPVHHTDAHPHPALQATGRAAATLRAAATSLTALLDPAVDNGASRAAADASAAFSELTAALHARPTKQWPNPTRTAHPALPRDTHRQQHPHR